MKTIFHQSNLEANRRRRTRGFIFLVLSLLLIVFAATFFDRFFGSAAFKVAQPLWSVRDYFGAGVGSIFSAIENKEALVSENQKLRESLAATKLLALENDRLKVENNALRLELGLRPSQSRSVVARVMSVPGESPYDIILATHDAATSSVAIKPGDLVTYRDSLALGRVIGMAGDVIKIALFSAGSQNTPAFIAPNRVPVILTSRSSGNFTAKVPQGLTITLDSRVMIADANRDYLIGTIGAITKTPGESLQTLYIKSPLPASLLSYVEIHSR